MQDIDISKLPPAMVKYAEIKNQYKDFLVFYRMGDFYELFFDDAITASNVLGITLTRRGKTENMNIPMCGVPYHAYESYLTRLVNQGYKVAICEQMETPEEAKKRGRSEIVRRDVVRLVTAGTLTEEDMLTAGQNNYLAAVVQSANDLGFAWLDLSTGEFYTKLITSDEQKLPSDLQNFIYMLEPSELLISDVCLQNPRLLEILNRMRERLTPLPQARFNVINAQKRLEKVFNLSTLEALGDFSKPEIAAAGSVLDYVENTQKGKLPRLKKPLKMNNVSSMQIDAATRENLELVNSTSNSRKATLLSVIDRTVSAAGGRLLRYRIKNPSADLNQINNRLDMVSFFVDLPEIRDLIRETLCNVYDVERAVARLSLARGGPRDLAGIGHTLALLPRLKNIIHNYGQYTNDLKEIPTFVEDTLKAFGAFSNLVDKLSRALKDDEVLPKNARDGGFIKEGYSVTLDHLKNANKNHEQETKALVEKYAAMTGISNIKINSNSIIGYYVEFPSKYAKEILQNPFFIFRQSVLNGARFSTAELTELESSLRQTAEQALSLEIELFNDLTQEILAHAESISQTMDAISELDVASGLADIAAERHYCRPILDNSLIFDIKGGRHPVVEAALERAHEGQFIDNNCLLDGLDNRIWLITGPNMAGKSTFLRQNAIIAVMAQMGSFVPCQEAHIGIIDKLFSRVGASDDLSRGRSTFMVEMVETAAILNQSTEHSFVILDEIGRGTATYDGLSLAWAVVEHLHDINHCRALFATHYHELTVLERRLKALSLHCMKIKEFQDNVIFMHEVIKGAADRSYGIHVAKLAGLPDLVVKRAEQILQALETNPERHTLTSIEDDLPLFSTFKRQTESTPKDKHSPLEEALQKLNPDDFTPRDALDKLYELKALLNK